MQISSHFDPRDSTYDVMKQLPATLIGSLNFNVDGVTTATCSSDAVICQDYDGVVVLGEASIFQG